jgi:hypothetical protein
VSLLCRRQKGGGRGFPPLPPNFPILSRFLSPNPSQKGSFSHTTIYPVDFPSQAARFSSHAMVLFPRAEGILPLDRYLYRSSQLSAVVAYAKRFSNRLSGTKLRLTPNVMLLPLAQRFGLAQH